MDFVHIAISARLARGDLVAADTALEAGHTDDGVGLILMKQLLVSCANVTDLELICRALYKD
ncbi:MAG: hypothetical protein IH582_06600, partial [Afipia sp.]|nr:hypothetical protein [Afipia sp.]